MARSDPHLPLPSNSHAACSPAEETEWEPEDGLIHGLPSAAAAPPGLDGRSIEAGVRCAERLPGPLWSAMPLRQNSRMSTPARALEQTESMIARLEDASSAKAVCRALLDSLAPLGARGLFAGSFPALPPVRLAEMVAGREVLAQISPRGWLQAYARRGLDAGNPVILAPGRVTAPFLWSEGGLPALKGWTGLHLAKELGISDGLAVPLPERAGRVGVLSLAFERFELSPYQTRMVQLLAIIGYERMRALTVAPPPAVQLTTRERDCLAFVAEGKSDTEIGDVLGLSAHTVHWHVENAKRKLGVRSRSQAVAKLYAIGLF